MSSPLWKIIQDWHDRHQAKPSWAKVAEALGVSQSTFDSWKKPEEMPRRRTLWVIHQLTGVPFKTVVDAAIESADLYNPKRAEASHLAHVEKKKEREAREHSAPATKDAGGPGDNAVTDPDMGEGAPGGDGTVIEFPAADPPSQAPRRRASREDSPRSKAKQAERDRLKGVGEESQDPDDGGAGS